METHVISHTRTRLQGDSEVNHVLDCRVSRASEYTGKKCITFAAESDYRKGLCKCKETTLHILNGCKVSLEMGRYLWRHNNIINYIFQSVYTDKFKVYADLPVICQSLTRFSIIF